MSVATAEPQPDGDPLSFEKMRAELIQQLKAPESKLTPEQAETIGGFAEVMAFYKNGWLNNSLKNQRVDLATEHDFDRREVEYLATLQNG